MTGGKESDAEVKKSEKAKKEKSEMIALRDFHLFCPPHIDMEIKKGDNLENVPEIFIQNLITEKVLKGK
jgi:hypothetical protein